jgi:hypothetical protein
MRSLEKKIKTDELYHKFLDLVLQYDVEVVEKFLEKIKYDIMITSKN